MVVLGQIFFVVYILFLETLKYNLLFYSVKFHGDPFLVCFTSLYFVQINLLLNEEFHRFFSVREGELH